MKTHDETLVRIVDHSFDPPRCLFGTQEDVLTGYAVDSLKSIGLAKANWYMRGDLPPRFPMPAILTDHALHMRYPRVLSEGDKANADDYFWRLYHRLYGKK